MAIIILFSAVLCLFSCSAAQKADALDILKLPAELKAEGERNGVEFCALITLGELRADGTRYGEISYSLPHAFGGLKVITDSGVWEAELDGVMVSGRSAEALGAPLAPFMQSNNADGADLIKAENGDSQTLITVKSNGGTVEYLIDSKSGYPISLREKNGEGETVMEFKITEYKPQKTN